MPILHSQVTAQAKSPEGKISSLTPVSALYRRGPIFEVTITIEEHAAQVLLAQRKPLPKKLGYALIDTGASTTCVDEAAARDLGLPVIDVGSIQSASHEKHPCNIYPVQIITPVITLNSARTIGANLASQNLLVLVGRAILSRCSLFYNGPSGQFTLSL